MTILAIGIDELTKEFLRSNSMYVESLGSYDFVDSIEDYQEHDAIIIDVDECGLYVCRDLQKKNINLCVVGLSSNTLHLSEDRATFLENGGDDLLKSPPNLRELLASVNSCIRRRSSGNNVTIKRYKFMSSILTYDNVAMRVLVDGTLINLTSREYKFLSVLIGSNGRYLEKDTLYSHIYSLDGDVEIKILDVFLTKIRKKFGVINEDARGFVETIWGGKLRFIGEEID